MVCGDTGDVETHENQGGSKIFIAFLYVFGIVLHHLSIVYGVEIKQGVVLDGLEVHS